MQFHMEIRIEPSTAPIVFQLSIIIKIEADLLFCVPFNFIT